MNTIKLRTHVGEDGILRLELPINIKNSDMEVIVVVQAVDKAVDKMGYPIGYFEETYGSMAHDPIERGEQLPLE